MSEMSRRRRWFGRGMVAAGALALPLTASISYAASNAQPAPPAPPAPSIAELPPASPAPPAAPELHEGDDRHLPGFVTRRAGPDGKHTVREFVWRGPQPPQFHAQGDWDSEEFQREMEEFQREMEQFREQWGEQYGAQWRKWAEEYGQDWAQWGEQWGRQWGEQHRAQALALAERHREQALARGERQREQAEQRREQARAWAEAARMAPVVVRSCDEDQRTRTATSDGRPLVVICPSDVRQFASSSLRHARESIAHNRAMSEEVRAEVLSDLDEEIARIERETD